MPTPPNPKTRTTRPPNPCLGCGRQTTIHCPACRLAGEPPERSAYCCSSPHLPCPPGHSHICASHFTRTHLVRAGLLARGMLLRGRSISHNKMVADAKRGRAIEHVHPASPSSELQFWLMSDTAAHLETWFSVIFSELLSGLPVKSVHAVSYIVDPRSVLPGYHKFVQHDPSHRVYKITLATTPPQAWVLDPNGARMGYDEMLIPWGVFVRTRSRDAKVVAEVKPDLAKFEVLMGVCDHRLERGGDEAGGESFVRRALRTWVGCWTDLLPEIFGGSMFNLGAMSHADFSVALDEFLAVFDAYVKTYLLKSAYYTSWLKDHPACVKWEDKLRDGHPDVDERAACGHKLDGSDAGPLEPLGCGGGHCECECHEELNRVLREVEMECTNRWELRTVVEDVAKCEVKELSKVDLLKVVQNILVERAGVKVRDGY